MWIRRIASCLLVIAVLPAFAAPAPDLDAQRKAFKAAYRAIERGDLSLVSGKLAGLLRYPLYPYLRYAYIDRFLDSVPPETVASFLDKYPKLPVTGALRYRWMRQLAQHGEWALFAKYYDGDEAPALVCASVSAGLAGDAAALTAARRERLVATAKRLWLSGHEQPRECDPAFDYLAEHKLLTQDMIGERFEKALAAHHLNLAGYLAEQLSSADRKRVAHWRRMAADPGTTLAAGGFSDNSNDRALLVYGLERLAGDNAASAKASWQDVKNVFDFDIHQRANIERQIALSEARQHLPDAYQDLMQVGASGYGLVKQWRIRTALWQGLWHAALAAMDDLPASRRGSDQWQYWRARALAETNHPRQADAIYRRLARDTGYYSFLAADRLGVAYSFSPRPSQPDEEVMAALDTRSGIVRARELFKTGLLNFAGDEWRAATDDLPTAKRCQAGLLAAGWQWHSAAIRTLSRGGCWDDLKLRYPMAFSEAVGAQAEALDLDPAWLYGMVRSESLFAAQAVSRAGALGLMQLMPATGHQVAARLGIDLDGDDALLDPAVNITLGSSYLNRIRGRFGDNPCLATAAYNAGPGNVDAWLPTQGPMASDVWVEAIPFRETRRYVRRVMAHTVVFDWRMGGKIERISDRMGVILPLAGTPAAVRVTAKAIN